MIAEVAEQHSQTKYIVSVGFVKYKDIYFEKDV